MGRDLMGSDLRGTGSDTKHRGTRQESERRMRLLERWTKDQERKMEEGHAQN